jgi:hypothetical protein
MIYMYLNPKPNVHFAFYTYVIDGDSSVTIMRPGSGAIVTTFFFWFVYLVSVVFVAAVLFMCVGNSNLWLCWQNVRFSQRC